MRGARGDAAALLGYRRLVLPVFRVASYAALLIGATLSSGFPLRTAGGDDSRGQLQLGTTHFSVPLPPCPKSGRIQAHVDHLFLPATTPHSSTFSPVPPAPAFTLRLLARRRETTAALPGGLAYDTAD